VPFGGFALVISLLCGAAGDSFGAPAPHAVIGMANDPSAEAFNRFRRFIGSGP
jgi:hypothetical protein